MIPAGAIGFSHPPRGRAGIVGRFIAWRQALQLREETLPGADNPGAISHVRLALGDGRLIEQTWPRWQITPESAAPADTIWYAPYVTYTDLQQARLIAGAEALAYAGGEYGLWSLVRFLVRGSLGAGAYVCTSGAALLTWIAKGADVSGVGQPWNVDLRTWLAFVHAAGWRRL